MDFASLSVVLGDGSLRSPKLFVDHRRKTSTFDFVKSRGRLWHLSFISDDTRLRPEMGCCARDSMRFLSRRRGIAGPFLTSDTDVKAVWGPWGVFKPGYGGLIRYRTARSVAAFRGSAWVLNTRQVFWRF